MHNHLYIRPLHCCFRNRLKCAKDEPVQRQPAAASAPVSSSLADEPKHTSKVPNSSRPNFGLEFLEPVEEVPASEVATASGGKKSKPYRGKNVIDRLAVFVFT